MIKTFFVILLGLFTFNNYGMAEMIFQSALPSLNDEIIEVKINGPVSPIFDQVIVTKLSSNGVQELARLKAAAFLPSNPDENYRDYKGERGTFFQLRIYGASKTPVACDAILRWIGLAESAPILMKRVK